jgi:hypothetical protein
MNNNCLEFAMVQEKKETAEKENQKKYQTVLLDNKKQFDLLQFYKSWYQTRNAKYDTKAEYVDIDVPKPKSTGNAPETTTDEKVIAKDKGPETQKEKAMSLSFESEKDALDFFTELATAGQKFIVIDGNTGNVLYYCKGDGKLEDVADKQMDLAKFFDSPQGAWARPKEPEPPKPSEALDKPEDDAPKKSSLKDRFTQQKKEDTPEEPANKSAFGRKG